MFVPSATSISSKYVPTTNISGILPDLVIKSSDSILFHVHTKVLNSISSNHFGGYGTPSHSAVTALEDSKILTIVLDIIYRNPNAAIDFAPPFPFDQLASAISRLPVYGVDPQVQLDSNTSNAATAHPIYRALLAHATTHALELYILAAQHKMESLAVAASTYLVGFHIADLNDEQAEAMGPRYLRRLILMQSRRESMLKRILLQPPYPHPSTPDCDVLDQKMLTKAWTLCAAYFVWDIRADLPSAALENLLGPLAGHVSCELCKRLIREQVTKIVGEWEAVKGTI